MHAQSTFHNIMHNVMPLRNVQLAIAIECCNNDNNINVCARDCGIMNNYYGNSLNLYNIIITLLVSNFNYLYHRVL